MKTIITFGDSVTDMGRNRAEEGTPFSLGEGYPFLLDAALTKKYPNKFKIINKGIGGNRSVDLYARVKEDVWNRNPDVISILIGVNDVWHEIDHQSGVELNRFENVLSTMIAETKQKLPNAKLILIEPFFLHGVATDGKFERFETVYEYAKVVKKIADKFNCVFVPMQERLNKAVDVYGAENVLYDGVHPTVNGSRLICEAVCEEAEHVFAE